MTKIVSFEVSDSDDVGDVLSKARKLKSAGEKLRVGLLCVAWFEWWPMFADTDLEKQVRDDAENVARYMDEHFGERYELIYPGMIDSLNTAADAGEELKSQHIDVLVIVENTYTTDFIPLETVEHLPNVPIIIFATQATVDLAPDMTNLDVIRYEGLVGNSQLVGAFTKMGLKYRVIAGSYDDPESYRRIGQHLTVLDVMKRLRTMDLGLLGHTFRGMYDIEIDKTKLKGAIGPNTFYIDMRQFMSQWERISADAVAAYEAELAREIPIQKHGVTQEDFHKSLRVGLALREVVTRFNLDAISVLGQHHLEMGTRSSGDFAPYTVEKMGCMYTFEGDMANLVMKKILQIMSGSLPVFVEWTAFDEPSNSMLLTHHGVVDPVLFCADMSKCRWTPAPEKWDFTGKGLSIEYAAKPGGVTLASLLDDKEEGWKILISQGECIEMEARPAWAPQFYFRPHMKITRYIEEILEEGVAHHVILVYGDYRAELELLADYLGIRKVTISVK